MHDARRYRGGGHMGRVLRREKSFNGGYGMWV